MRRTPREMLDTLHFALYVREEQERNASK